MTDNARAAQDPAETCGAQAQGGRCTLPRGHNMGRADVPQNHQHKHVPGVIDGLRQCVICGWTMEPDR